MNKKITVQPLFKIYKKNNAFIQQKTRETVLICERNNVDLKKLSQALSEQRSLTKCHEFCKVCTQL
jgi:hypothetical protein